MLATIMLFISSFYCATALKSQRLLDDMAGRGVKYVDCYGVDNVLVSTLFFKKNIYCNGASLSPSV